jgi:hypothetical protein
MTAVESTAPTRRASLPLCFATRRSGRWLGVVLFQSDEHHTARRFGTRAAALADAKRIAATLVRDDSALQS